MIRSLACLIVVASWAQAEGLSTAFSNPNQEITHLGKSFAITDRYGDGVLVRNLGSDAIVVRSFFRTSASGHGNKQCKPVPNLNWLEVMPSQTTVDLHDDVTLQLRIKIPSERRWRGQRWCVELIVESQADASAPLHVEPSLRIPLQLSVSKNARLKTD